MNVLSTITSGNHMYFNKSYEPPPKSKERLEVMVDNNDAFFTGLPPSHSKTKRATTASLCLTEAQRLEV